jgi:DNA-binding FadR family transcriptional regulator
MAPRTGLIDIAVERLRLQITSGVWTVGTRIPTEPELTAFLGVGRNTVREAVQALVHAGLLARRQGSGTYVLSDSELGLVMSREFAGATHRDVLEVRRAIEVEAARLAAGRRTPDDVEMLRTHLAGRAAALRCGDVEAVAAADLALHAGVVHASHNPVLVALYESLLGAIRENIRTNLERPLSDHEAHVDLIAAIENGTPEEALAQSASYLSELFEQG